MKEVFSSQRDEGGGVFTFCLPSGSHRRANSDRNLTTVLERIPQCNSAVEEIVQ